MKFVNINVPKLYITAVWGDVRPNKYKWETANFSNYGHDDFSIGLLKDTMPHVEIQLISYGAKHSFL